MMKWGDTLQVIKKLRSSMLIGELIRLGISSLIRDTNSVD